MGSNTQTWEGLADLPDEEPDEVCKNLLKLAPEHMRPMAGPMLMGFLSNVKSQLTPEQYAKFGEDMGDAYAAHAAGNAEAARELLAVYGIDYALLQGMVS